MAQPANIALEGDPRLSLHEKDNVVAQATTNPQNQARNLHDPAVTFDEYMYYAKETRAEEAQQYKPSFKERSLISMIIPSKADGGVQQVTHDPKEENPAVVSDIEWDNASRALRTASRGAVFYLITTDILGPFGLPYAFTTMGWGPGVALYTVFAGLAGYSGYLLWDVFMGLDSYRHPIHSYGDLAYRVYGRYVRHGFNILQGIQLVLNVGLIIISNGEALSQASKFRVCFIVCCLIWAIVGFVVGQVRTLQKFGWLANCAVWLNLICMFVTMGAAAHSAPNYQAVSQSAGAAIDNGVLIKPNAQGVFPPVQHSAGLPNTGGFAGSVSGAMQAIYAYGGAMVFPEFMAEMKRPKDFLTAMWGAQAFIYFWYMFYGLFMYGYQGQYTVNPSYLSIGPYNLQTAGNAFAMASAAIAAALYGNIGMKVIYNNIFMELLRFPPLTSRMGKFLWAIIIPIYWAIAFVLAAAIPNFSGLTSVVAAICILQFTYTFPPFLHIGYRIQRAAMQNGEGFDPATGQTVRHDKGVKRFIRGFLGAGDQGFGLRDVIWSVANLLYTLGALCLAALGAYSAIETLITAFASSTTTSFVCKSPLQ